MENTTYLKKYDLHVYLYPEPIKDSLAEEMCFDGIPTIDSYGTFLYDLSSMLQSYEYLDFSDKELNSKNPHCYLTVIKNLGTDKSIHCDIFIDVSIANGYENEISLEDALDHWHIHEVAVSGSLCIPSGDYTVGYDIEQDLLRSEFELSEIVLSKHHDISVHLVSTDNKSNVIFYNFEGNEDFSAVGYRDIFVHGIRSILERRKYKLLDCKNDYCTSESKLLGFRLIETGKIETIVISIKLIDDTSSYSTEKAIEILDRIHANFIWVLRNVEIDNSSTYQWLDVMSGWIEAVDLFKTIVR